MEKNIDLKKINIKQHLMSLHTIINRINYNEINLDTKLYLLKKREIWTDEIKSSFIEALIVRQPVPAFYFDTTNNEKWLIVDGLQRLNAVKEFIYDKTLKLKDLFYLSKDYEGKTFDEISRSAQLNIERYDAIVYTIEAPTPEEVKYKIFRSINIGTLI